MQQQAGGGFSCSPKELLSWKLLMLAASAASGTFMLNSTMPKIELQQVLVLAVPALRGK